MVYTTSVLRDVQKLIATKLKVFD